VSEPWKAACAKNECATGNSSGSAFVVADGDVLVSDPKQRVTFRVTATLDIQTTVGDSAYIEIAYLPKTGFTTLSRRMTPRYEVATRGVSVDRTLRWKEGRIRVGSGVFQVRIQVTPVDGNGDGRARAIGNHIDLTVEVE
jgi:hypothetical protein